MTQDIANTSIAPRKEVIMREAAYLFRRKGYSATTLRELAKRAGIQGGSIYHHFASKQEIVFKIITETMAELLHVQNVIEKEQNPVEKLRKAVRFHLGLTKDKPDEMHITDAELWFLSKPQLEIVVGQRMAYNKIYFQIIEEGTRRKLMNVNNLKLATTAILQMLTGISYWFKEDGPFTILEIADEYINIMLWGTSGKSVER